MKRWGRTRMPVMEFDVTEVGASRALYQSAEEESRMLIRMKARNGQDIEVEMSMDCAHKLIEQMAATYHIVRPELRTRRSQIFGQNR